MNGNLRFNWWEENINISGERWRDHTMRMSAKTDCIINAVVGVLKGLRIDFENGTGNGA